MFASTADGPYRISVGDSRLGFRAKAFLSLWVKGTLSPTSGEVVFQPDGSLRATGSAPASSIKTGIGARDWHLRHKHYLHAEAHPEIRLEVVSPATPGAKATGQLHARGRSLPIELTIESIARTDERLEVTARGRFDRAPLGMLPRLMGVSQMIELNLQLVATR